MISMNELAALAAGLVEAERATEDAELALKRAKENERSLREEALPLAMQELGLCKVALDSGQTISIKQDVYASIPASGKDDAYEWIEDNGFGGLIKTIISVQYGKGELDKAQELLEELQEKGLNPDIKRDVHAQTLKAFLNEQIGKGAAVPLDLFGARPVFVAKVK